MVANQRQNCGINACINLLLTKDSSQSLVIHVIHSCQKYCRKYLHCVIIGIFVDDLLVNGNSILKINEVREIMNQSYCLIDQGHLEYYLRVEVTQSDENTLMLHQAGFINKILDSYNMSECTPVSTPLPLNSNRVF